MRKFVYILTILICVGAVLLLPHNEVTAIENEIVPAVTPIATPTPSPTPTPTPTPTPKPTPTPSPTPFMVDVNALYEGINDANEGGSEVTRLQNRLAGLGYYEGESDGIYGKGTAEAVKYFQKCNGLPETGVADAYTQYILYSSEAISNPEPTQAPIKSGSKGDDVKELQTLLVRYGFMATGADGDYGKRTESGVLMAENYIQALKLNYPRNYATPAPSYVFGFVTPTPTPIPEATVVVTRVSNSGTTTIKEITTTLPTPTPTSTLRPTPEATEWTATGEVTEELLSILSRSNFTFYICDVQNGDTSDEALRVQNRLATLKYLRTSAADGVFGDKTELALKYFQYLNGLEETGIADRATQRVLYSDGAVASDVYVTQYKIVVSTSKQRVYVYEWNGTGFDTEPLKTFKCSTGKNDTPTPKGTFWNTGRLAQWWYFKDFDCWAKYAWTISGGILFHSVIFSSKSDSAVKKSTINALGKKASHGCVRLAVDDAKWIYQNCANGTPVTVE